MKPGVEDVSILTAVTPDYLPYLAVQLFSACESAAQTTRLNYTILHVGIVEQKKEMTDLIGSRHKVSWHFIEPEFLKRIGAPACLNGCDPHFFRLLAPYVFPDVERVIYLDADTLIIGDLAQLWRQRLDGYAAGAVRDLFPTFRDAIEHLDELNLSAETPYFNTGVLLINLDLWRRVGLVTIVLKYVKRHPKGISAPTRGGFLQWDQYGLNVAMANWCKELPADWNFFSRRPASSDAPFIVHFVGDAKPGTPRCQERFSALFFDILSRTPWSVGNFRNCQLRT
jgi:lipopolysaccharide biosynthesis glycosyltransferase